MTAHNHSELVRGCYRCDLGRDEGDIPLSDFLLARIAEDEADANAAAGPWWVVSEDLGISTRHGWKSDDQPWAVPHVLRNSPSRILAECEAKRRIIDYCDPEWGPVLAFLALPYADHPDYRDEWRP